MAYSKFGELAVAAVAELKPSHMVANHIGSFTFTHFIESLTAAETLFGCSQCTPYCLDFVKNYFNFTLNCQRTIASIGDK